MKTARPEAEPAASGPPGFGTTTGPRGASLLLLAALLLGSLACRNEDRGSCEGCNVVLVLADTLRADRLASYGYYRVTSPFLDRFGDENIRFADARSQSACTFPSVNSLLTSRSVSHFMSPETRPGIPEWVESMPTILARMGYRTAAVSASPIVRRTPSSPGLGGGFDQGFETFDESILWARSRVVTQSALARLRELKDEKFFLYVHYMDPHDPYRPYPEHRGIFAPEYSGSHLFVAEGKAAPIEARIAAGESPGVSRADMRHLSDLYDETILGLDEGLFALHRGLSELDLLDRTLVVVAADHGEAFLEHGSIKHCHDLLDTESHVPLLMRIPGRAGGRQIDELAENLDILPTIIDYLGFDSKIGNMEGLSLRPLIDRGEKARSFAFSTMGNYRSVNDRRFKLIFSLPERQYRFFDRQEDPGETRNLLGRRPREEKRLQRALREWMKERDSDLSDDEKIRRALEIERELRALGYLG